MSWYTLKNCEINKKKNLKGSNVRFHRFPNDPVFENKCILACGKPFVNVNIVHYLLFIVYTNKY